jgi:Predicted redox protein, regulator of disulfide bond formation
MGPNKKDMDTAEEVELEIEYSESKVSPRIRADVKTENFGVFILESDPPRFIGGRGSRPTPLQYIVFGIAAMYIMTLANTLARNGMEVSKILTRASCRVDFARPRRRGNRLGVTLTVRITPEKPYDALHKILDQAKNECPIFRGLDIQISTW